MENKTLGIWKFLINHIHIHIKYTGSKHTNLKTEIVKLYFKKE